MKRILKTGILILAVMMGASACAGSGSAQEDDVKNSDSPSFEDGIYTGSHLIFKLLTDFCLAGCSPLSSTDLVQSLLPIGFSFTVNIGQLIG